MRALYDTHVHTCCRLAVSSYIIYAKHPIPGLAEEWFNSELGVHDRLGLLIYIYPVWGISIPLA